MQIWQEYFGNVSNGSGENSPYIKIGHDGGGIHQIDISAGIGRKKYVNPFYYDHPHFSFHGGYLSSPYISNDTSTGGSHSLYPIGTHYSHAPFKIRRFYFDAYDEASGIHSNFFSYTVSTKFLPNITEGSGFLYSYDGAINNFPLSTVTGDPIFQNNIYTEKVLDSCEFSDGVIKFYSELTGDFSPIRYYEIDVSNFFPPKNLTNTEWETGSNNENRRGLSETGFYDKIVYGDNFIMPAKVTGTEYISGDNIYKIKWSAYDFDNDLIINGFNDTVCGGTLCPIDIPSDTRIIASRFPNSLARTGENAIQIALPNQNPIATGDCTILAEGDSWSIYDGTNPSFKYCSLSTFSTGLNGSNTGVYYEWSTNNLFFDLFGKIHATGNKESLSGLVFERVDVVNVLGTRDPSRYHGNINYTPIFEKDLTIERILAINYQQESEYEIGSWDKLGDCCFWRSDFT